MIIRFCIIVAFLTGLMDGASAQLNSGLNNYSNAQQFMNDANGRPLYVHTDYSIEGSPFYYPEYCTAVLKVQNGKTYSGVKVKINLLDNSIVYDAGDGKEMVATSAIEQIRLYNCSEPSKNQVLVSGMPGVDKQDSKAWYIRLDSGSVHLLKYIQVIYRDTKYYGSNLTTRVFEQKESYYAYSSDKGMVRLARDNEVVMAVLAGRKKQVQDFVAANEIRCKKEADLVKLFQYYNSLSQ